VDFFNSLLGRSLREYGVSIVGPGARPYKMQAQKVELSA
jgi:hypothetical protein